VEEENVRFAFLLILLAGTLVAQADFPALTATRPDADRADKLMLFGQFVGDWTFHGVEYHDDGSQANDAGEIQFRWILEGRALQDVWRETVRSDSAPLIHGTTLRFYDSKLGEWRVIWIEPRLGVVTNLTAQVMAEQIVLTGQSANGGSIRWIFSDIKKDSFRWHGERLTNGKWRIYEEVWAQRVNLKGEAI
jgi:hypothetical protein